MSLPIENPEKKHVILIHGLLMRPLMMRYLGRRLKQNGFEAHYIGYNSFRHGPPDVCLLLEKLVRQIQSNHLYFVAHSLGGLMLIHFLQKFPELKYKRIVLIASPINGSKVARVLSKNEYGKKLLGPNRDILITGVSDIGLKGVGMIAGTLGLGLGRLICQFEEPRDGAVALSETTATWLAGHRVVHQSHAGALFSPTVAQLTIRFLNTGDFFKDSV